MEIIAIERQTFEQIKERLVTFAKQVKKLCANDQSKGKWLDNQDVCELLNISKRSLQYYRNCGKLSFSQINNKCYYKVADVEKLLKDSSILKPSQP